MGKVIGIVGTRSRDTASDLILCEQMFSSIYEDGDTIVSGGCLQGGDNFAEVIARKKGISITIYHAQWLRYGKRAGPMRNSLIADACDILIALVPTSSPGYDNANSGTMDTVTKVESQNKKVIRI